MGTLAEALRPHRQKLLQGSATVHPLVALTADLPAADDATLERARTTVLRWLAAGARAGSLPEPAWRHEGFERPQTGRSVLAVRLQDGTDDRWMARLEQALEDARDGVVRTFTTEACVRRDGAAARIALRQEVATHEAELRLVPQVPGLVRHWADGLGLVQDGRAVAAVPWTVATPAEAAALIELVDRPDRTRPVVVVSLAEEGGRILAPVVDPQALAQRLLGLAHVAVIEPRQTFQLTTWWGKTYSCFHGAVRLYWAPFDHVAHSCYAHPLFQANQVRAWQQQHGVPFADHLVRLVAEASVRRWWRDPAVPSFAQLRRDAAAQERRRLDAQPTVDHAAARENLERELRAAEALAQSWLDEAIRLEQAKADLEETLAQKQAETAWLRARVHALEVRLEQAGARETVPIPNDYAEIETWAGRYLAGRLVLLPRAIRAARNGVYRDPALVYRCLLALAHEYRTARVAGGRAARDALEARFQELGVVNTQTGDVTRAGAEGDTYFPVYEGRRRYLEWHLKKGTGRSPETCLRIYYFYDDERDLVVVGWLPSHLRTRIS